MHKQSGRGRGSANQAGSGTANGKGTAAKKATQLSQQPVQSTQAPFKSKKLELNEVVQRLYKIQGKKLEKKELKDYPRLIMEELDDINLEKLKETQKVIEKNLSDNDKSIGKPQTGNQPQGGAQASERTKSMADVITDEIYRLKAEIDSLKIEVTKSKELKKTNEKQSPSSKDENNASDMLKEFLTQVGNKMPSVYKRCENKAMKKSTLDIFKQLYPEVVYQAKEKQMLEEKVEKIDKELRETKAQLVDILKTAGCEIKTGGQEQIPMKIKEYFIRLQDEKTEKEMLWKYVLQKMDKASQSIRDIKEPGKIDKQGLLLDMDKNSKELEMFNSMFTIILEEVEKMHYRMKENERKLQTMEALRSENENLQMRLSKVAGSRLTDGNPNITNLGDPNRPMKIGELYSELYDNEWTDIVDKCAEVFGKKKDEEIVIKTLYHTLIWCYKTAEATTDQILNKARNEIQNAFYMEGHDEEIIHQSKPFIRFAGTDKFFQMVKSNKDLPKMMKDSKIDKTIFDKVILKSKYFEKCFHLCWKMVVQDPQMYLQEGPRVGLEYDRNVFREYTTSGSKVVFTIWPALFLHRGGPLLVKGVLKVE